MGCIRRRQNEIIDCDVHSRCRRRNRSLWLNKPRLIRSFEDLVWWDTRESKFGIWSRRLHRISKFLLSPTNATLLIKYKSPWKKDRTLLWRKECQSRRSVRSRTWQSMKYSTSWVRSLLSSLPTYFSSLTCKMISYRSASIKLNHSPNKGRKEGGKCSCW